MEEELFAGWRKARTSNIPQVDRGGQLPVSFAQQRLWFLDQLEPDSAEYIMPFTMRLKGSFDTAALDIALTQLVSRHEILRANIMADESRDPRLVIRAAESMRAGFIDVSGIPDMAQRESTALAKMGDLAAQPFDLAHDELLRAHVIRIDYDDHLLVVTMHHIVSDGWSMSVFTSELREFYTAAIERRKPVVPMLPVQYADYAAWQHETLSGPKLDRLLSFWKTNLDGISPLDLPTDRVRPVHRTGEGDILPFTVSPGTVTALHELTRQTGSSLFMVGLSVFHILLAQWAGTDDIAVATPIAGRNRSEVENLIGFFINTLVLRSRVDQNLTFREYLATVADSTVDAFDHQDLPFERLVQELAPERDLTRNVLAEALFALQNVPEQEWSLPGLDVARLGSADLDTTFDLSLYLSERSDGALIGELQYAVELFDVETAERVVTHYQTLLKRLTDNLDTPLSQLDLLPESERNLLLKDWNHNDVDFPVDDTLHSWFEQQAQTTPDAVAVVCGDTSVTYQQLNERANRLAHKLLSTDRTQNNPVIGVYIGRNVDAVSAYLAVLKTGSAYLPLDPEYPADRLALMLRDAQVPLLITDKTQRDTIPATDAQVIVIDDSDEHVTPCTNPGVAVSTNDLAYVIYTSGSTGLPKGVATPHSCVVDRMQAMSAMYQMTSDDRFLQFASLSFDTADQVFLALLCGGRTIMRQDGEITPEALTALINDQGVTIAEFTPALWDEMLHAGTPDLGGNFRLLITGGEKARASTISQWFRDTDVPVINAYGPTETTLYCTMHRMTEAPDTDNVPIGRPLPNTNVYILDPYGRPTPVGAVGELCIGGLGVAAGYLNRPDLTVEKFVPDPFTNHPKAMLYRTGDQARWNRNGEIEFLGRADGQVKLRGFRIELGEIETALSEHPSVASSIVDVRQGSTGPRLVAYIIPTADETMLVEDLSIHVSERLPGYMVPTHYVPVEKFPLNPNGKVSRSSLPDPDLAAQQSCGRAPRNTVEATLVTIWTEILGTADISIDDNFFALGGHSLLATRIVSRIRAELGADLPVRSLFTAPTIAALATSIDQAEIVTETNIPIVDRNSEPLPLSFAQQRLWFLDQLDPNSPEYVMPVALRLKGTLDVEALQTALDALIERHESLRTNFCVNDDGQPYQRIHQPVPFNLQTLVLENIHSDERELVANTMLRELTVKPFQLDTDTLVRGTLLRLDDDDHMLVITIHHIISDGWSMAVFTGELREIYSATVEGRSFALVDLPIQYADYAVWQREQLSGDGIDRHLRFWRNELDDLRPLELPTDYPRPLERNSQADSVRFQLPVDLTDRLKALAAAHDASLFMVGLAAYQLLLARWSNSTDVAVATPIAGRMHADVENLIGFFINTLVLRARIDPNSGFVGLLRHVRDRTSAAYDHQDLPFERLVDELSQDRDLTRNAFTQVMFALQNLPEENWTLAGVDTTHVETEVSTRSFDLSVFLAEDVDGSLIGQAVFDKELFTADTIGRFVSQYRTLLSSIVADVDVPVKQIEILPAEEKKLLLVDWNDTKTVYPPNRCVHELVEAQAVETPDAPAVIHRERVLSFAELDEQANRLARYLVGNHGIGRGTSVCIFLDRSPEVLVSILGVLKAGASYVPLDPAHPAERLRHVINDSAASIILTDESHESELPTSNAKSVLWEDLHAFLPAYSSTRLAAAVESDDLAYLIYTSGSTGQPKGVMLEHGSVVNYLLWANDAYPANGADGAVLHSSLIFDLTVTTLFLPLIQGLPIEVADQPVDSFSSLDAHFLQEHHDGRHYSLLKATPSHLELLTAGLSADHRTANAASIVIGGEALTSRLSETVFETFPNGTVITNEYGPTEATVGCVYHQIRDVTAGSATIPIGTPIANTEVYVVDEHQQLAPIGVPGELLVGGRCLARGYLNQPELTAEKFIPNPYSTDPAARLYRTGDLVRWNSTGIMEYLGRKDNQVKIRGYRIELEEIENALKTCDAVSSAVVLAETVGADKRLAAYVTAIDGLTPDIDDMYAELRHRLPSYMVPHRVMVVETIPLTTNGKVDGEALAAQVSAGAKDCSPSVDLPRDDVERQLAAVWEEVLGIDSVGIHDNFFDLGGDSILSIQIISRARKCGIELSPKMIFRHQTVASLAAASTDVSRPVTDVGSVDGAMALSPIQRWFLDGPTVDKSQYNQVVLVRGNDLLPQLLERAAHELVRQHDALRVRVTNRQGIWQQEYGPMPTGLVHCYDVGTEPGSDRFSDVANRIQESLDIEDGPLIRFGLINDASDDGQYLLIVVHHLVIDEVSWSILLEDLRHCYDAVRRDESPSLPAKTSSFKAWTTRLSSYSESAVLRAEAAYWKKQTTTWEIPRDREGPNTVDSLDAVSVTLGVDDTETLLRTTPAAFGTRINDALVAVVSAALAEWADTTEVCLAMEGHGREDLFSDIDLSRTIGWFTSMFPVLVSGIDTKRCADNLINVRRTLEAIPSKGIGYGVLRYLSSLPEAQPLALQESPDISFNYLGQSTGGMVESGWGPVTDKPLGNCYGEGSTRRHVLDIEADIREGILSIRLFYSSQVHFEATMHRLAAAIEAQLSALIEATKATLAEPASSVAEFPLADLNPSELDSLLHMFGS